MAAHADAVAADRRLAPDAVAARRPIDEQPRAQRIPAMAEPAAFPGEREHGLEKVVGDAVPTRRGGPERAVARKPKGDTPEVGGDRGVPGGEIQARIVGKGTGERADRSQAFELADRRGRPRCRHGMGRQELDGVERCIQVVVPGIPSLRAPSIVGTRPVRSVGESQRRIGAQE